MTQRFARWLLVSMLAAGAAVAGAQGFPDKPVRIVLPLAAGSATDSMMRAMAPRMSAALGAQLVIENMPGAGGVVGSAAMAKAPADGYSLVMGSSGAFAASPHLHRNLPYNPVKDFAPVCRIGGGAYVLAVNPALGVKTLPELLAKARATSLSFASSGIGGTPHMAQELFKARVATPFVHVPYKGSPQAVSDTVAGHAQVVMDAPGPLMASIRGGKLVPIGITSGKRTAALPEIPTFAELGHPDIKLQGWIGLVAPAGTPAAAIDKLAQACRTALAAPEVQAHAVNIGFDIDHAGPAEFGPYIASELALWGELVKLAGIKPE